MFKLNGTFSIYLFSYFTHELVLHMKLLENRKLKNIKISMGNLFHFVQLFVSFVKYSIYKNWKFLEKIHWGMHISKGILFLKWEKTVYHEDKSWEYWIIGTLVSAPKFSITISADARFLLEFFFLRYAAKMIKLL